MNHHRAGVVLHLLKSFSLILLAGCATQQAFKNGNLSLEHGDYDAAYSHFKEASEGSPENVEYKAALERAKTKAQQNHFANAQEHFTNGDMHDAKQTLSRALGYSPENPEYLALLKEITTAIAAAETKKAEALSLVQEEQWGSALAAIDEAMAIDKSLANGDVTRSDIKDKAASYYALLGQHSLEKGDLEAAEAAARKSLEFVAGHRAPSQILEDVRKQREADGLFRQAEQAFAEQRYLDALTLLSRTETLRSPGEETLRLRQEIKESYCEKQIQDGRKLLTAGQPAQAIDLFDKSQQMIPGYGRVETLITEAYESLAGQYHRMAERERKADRWGCALVYTLLANAHNADESTRAQIDAAVAQILKRLDYRVAIVGFKSESQNREAASTLASRLLEDILAARPRNVSVMDRADLDRVLEEQSLSATDLIDPEYAVAAGRLRGVSAIIVGELSMFSIGQDKTSSNGSSNYQSGTRLVENPGYGLAEMSYGVVARNVAQMERDLAQSQQQLREVSYMPASQQRNEYLSFVRRAIDQKSQQLQSARRSLAAEEARLASVPRMIEEPVVLSHSYPIYHFTKTARMKVFIKMVDTETGEVLWSESIDGLAEVSDRVVDPDPFHNVDGDPLDLPDDQFLRDRCMLDVLEKIRPAVHQALKGYQDRYILAASRNESLGHTEDAVNQYVSFLFCGAGTLAERDSVAAKIDSLIVSDPHVTPSSELKKVLPSR